MNKVSEITYRYKSRVKLDQTPVITGSKDAYPIFWEHWNKDTIEMEEEFYIMLLNYGNRVKGLVKISTGGIKGTVVDAKKDILAGSENHVSFYHTRTQPSFWEH
jgi:DNA repair protein RadC